MKKTSSLLLMLSGLVCLANSCRTTLGQTTPQQKVGSVSEGWRLWTRLVKTTDRAETALPTDKHYETQAYAKQNEELTLEFWQENVSNNELILGTSSAEKDFFLSVKTAQGADAKLTDYGKTLNENRSLITMSIGIHVKANDWREFTLPLSKMYDLSKPGVYTISAYRYVMKPQGKEASKLLANTVELTVR